MSVSRSDLKEDSALTRDPSKLQKINAKIICLMLK